MHQFIADGWSSSCPHGTRFARSEPPNLPCPTSLSFAGLGKLTGAISCAFRVGFLTYFSAQMYLPVVFLLALVAAWVVTKYVLLSGADEARHNAVDNRVFSLMNMVAFFLFPGLCSAVFSFFKCHEVDGTRYLVADYR